MSDMGADYELECLLDKNFGNVIIIDNIPKVPKKKFDRLSAVLRKVIESYGKIILEKDGEAEYDGLFLPTFTNKDGKEKTVGYAMVEYEERAAAQAAVKVGSFRLDKKHILKFHSFTDYDRFMSTSETFTEPKKAEYVKKANLTSWLLDPDFRDQFVVRYASETEIYWNDPIRHSGTDGRQLQYGGERQKENSKTWTDGLVEWSPKGNYLVTYHTKGIALWGGEEFDKLGRFGHSDVKVIEFSPNEKYLITCNGKAKVKNDDPPSLIVWDVTTTTKLRCFDKVIRPEDWPVFQWSHDDKYLARVRVLDSTTGGKKKKRSNFCVRITRNEFT